MFPAMESDVLAAVLTHHSGNVEAAVVTLLDLASDGPSPGAEADDPNEAQIDLDAQMAALAQEEMDEETARALALAFKDEADRAQAAQAAARPSVRASAAASSVSGGAKSFMSRIRSAGRRAPKEGAVRLLDGDGVADSSTPSAPMEPLEPIYSPPVPQMPPAPLTQPATAPLTIASLPPAPPAAAASLPMGTSPPLGTSPPSAEKYTSRVDRARAANSARLGRSASNAAAVQGPPPVQLEIDPTAFLPAAPQAGSDSAQQATAQQQGSGPVEGTLI